MFGIQSFDIDMYNLIESCGLTMKEFKFKLNNNELPIELKTAHDKYVITLEKYLGVDKND